MFHAGVNHLWSQFEVNFSVIQFLDIMNLQGGNATRCESPSAQSDE